MRSSHGSATLQVPKEVKLARAAASRSSPRPGHLARDRDGVPLSEQRGQLFGRRAAQRGLGSHQHVEEAVLLQLAVGVPDRVVQPGGALEGEPARHRPGQHAGQFGLAGVGLGHEAAGAELSPVPGSSQRVQHGDPALVAGHFDVPGDAVRQGGLERSQQLADLGTGRQRRLHRGQGHCVQRGRGGDGGSHRGGLTRQRHAERQRGRARLQQQRQPAQRGGGQHQRPDQLGVCAPPVAAVGGHRLGQRQVPRREDRRVVQQGREGPQGFGQCPSSFTVITHLPAQPRHAAPAHPGPSAGQARRVSRPPAASTAPGNGPRPPARRARGTPLFSAVPGPEGRPQATGLLAADTRRAWVRPPRAAACGITAQNNHFRSVQSKS